MEKPYQLTKYSHDPTQDCQQRHDCDRDQHERRWLVAVIVWLREFHFDQRASISGYNDRLQMSFRKNGKSPRCWTEACETGIIACLVTHECAFHRFVPGHFARVTGCPGCGGCFEAMPSFWSS
jgi:hypothetical protein